MPQQDEVYVLPDEDFLEGLKIKAGVGKTPLAAVTERDSGSGARAGRASAARRSGDLSAPFRSPIASTLSMFVCGAGQAYNGQVKLGVLLFLTEILAIAAHWAAIRSWPVLLKVGELFSVNEWRMFQSAAAADFALLLVIVFGVVQAYYEAGRLGIRYPGARSPIISGAASMVVPGWGQILNAQPGKAAFFLLSTLTEAYLILLIWLSPISRLLAENGREDLLGGNATFLWMGIFFMAGMTWVLSVYDAALVAIYHRRSG